jgi:hypothetical protein
MAEGGLKQSFVRVYLPAVIFSLIMVISLFPLYGIIGILVGEIISSIVISIIWIRFYSDKNWMITYILKNSIPLAIYLLISWIFGIDLYMIIILFFFNLLYFKSTVKKIMKLQP